MQNVHERWRVIEGDVEDAARGKMLAGMGPFDALLCDPPYGIMFMGSTWDHGVPSAEVWRALAEHLRPGAGVVAFGGTRTWHRLAVAMEDAGLEMRDSLVWHYATGWPKPADVGKYVDKRLGAARDVTGANPNARPNRAGRSGHACGTQTAGDVVTAPATLAARRFDGWHANLAPSWEPALVFRRPLDGTLADNALAHGVAGLWVDGARVPAHGRELKEHGRSRITRSSASSYDVGIGRHTGYTNLGRWPKNAIFCCEETTCGGAEQDGEHAPGCPVYEMNEQGGWRKSGGPGTARANNKNVYGRANGPRPCDGRDDEGYVSRFFYVAKVSRKERAGIPHPCMKPIKLCQQIATLLLPPPRRDGRPRRILVPYSGSGSEMIGALQAGWDQVVGVELDPAWTSAARERVAREMAAWDEAREALLAERRLEYARRVAVTREAVKTAQDPEILAEYGDGYNK
jgi:site-specific DNA-methyltransferase (adenine-specific)